mmetsp:Transcript_13100/g.25025  ORF Transcript_13100/g.25025 Transcript_13100/m.25025 type:complete len:223 (+) Transcript_13100:106-774(+)
MTRERMESLCSVRSVSNQSSNIFLTIFTVSSLRSAFSTMLLTFSRSLSSSMPGISRSTALIADFLVAPLAAVAAFLVAAFFVAAFLMAEFILMGVFFLAETAFLAGGVFLAGVVFLEGVFLEGVVFFAFLVGVSFLADPFPADPVDFLLPFFGVFLSLALGFSSHSKKRSHSSSFPGVFLLSKLSAERSMSARSMVSFKASIFNLYILILILSCSASSFPSG